jgi:hypothetical protein
MRGYYTLREIEKLFGIGSHRITRWIREGRFPVSWEKVGPYFNSPILVVREEFDEWWKEHSYLAELPMRRKDEEKAED